MVCKVQLLIRNSREALKEIQNHQNCCCCCFNILFSLQSAAYPFTFYPFFHFMKIMLCPSTLFTYLCTSWNNRSPDPRITCVSFSGNRKGVSESQECFCPPTSTPEAQSVRSQVWSQILDWLERDVLHHSGSIWGSMEESWVFQRLRRTHGGEPREVMVLSWNTGLLLHRLLLHHTRSQCWIRHWSWNFFAPVCCSKSLTQYQQRSVEDVD